MQKISGFFSHFMVILGGEKTNLQITNKVILAVGAAFIAWMILKRVLHLIEKREKAFEFIKIDSRIYDLADRVLKYLIFLLAGAYVIRTLDVRLIENAFYALVIVLLAVPVKDFLMIVLEYFQKVVAPRTDTKIDNIIFDLLYQFAGIIIYVTAILLALDRLGINVMPFVAGAGVAGIAVGFAAKDTLSNLIAGVLLIIDRPFEMGDRIEVWSAPRGSSTWGDVVDIGLRATKIKTTDNIVIVIPNNEIMKRDIINYTINTAKIRVRVNIGVAYDTNIEEAKNVITAVAQSVQWIAKNPPPKVVVRNFGESSVDLQLRVWIDNARKRMDTISFITDRVKSEFDKTGIEIPYPRRDITVHNK